MELPFSHHWKFIRKLLENTTGGLDRIVLIRSNDRFRLFLWCSVYVFLTVFMIEFCLNSIKAYSEFPTTTSINIREGRLSVPSITLCSKNPFKRRELCRGQFANLCESGTTFTSAFAQLTAENDSDEFSEHYSQAFYKVEDLVVSCSLGGLPCESGAKPFFTPVITELQRYGQCYCMFCEEGREYSEALRFRVEEPRNALVLQLRSSIKEYLPHIDGVGFVFLFHTYRKSAMVNRDSVHVGMGETTFLRLETVKIKLLPAPYPSRCGSDWPREYDGIEGIDSEQYSYSTCMGICFAQQVIRECNCHRTKHFAQLSVLDNICRGSLKEYRCRVEKLSNPKTYRANCKCQNECSMNSYVVRASRAGFPRSLSKFPGNHTLVIIYQGLSDTIVVGENAKYRFSQLIEALGSNMNTFTGLSFLVIYEFVDVIISWISHITDSGIWEVDEREMQENSNDSDSNVETGDEEEPRSPTIIHRNSADHESAESPKEQ